MISTRGYNCHEYSSGEKSKIKSRRRCLGSIIGRLTVGKIEVLAEVTGICVHVEEPTVDGLMEATSIIVRDLRLESQEWNAY